MSYAYTLGFRNKTSANINASAPSTIASNQLWINFPNVLGPIKNVVNDGQSNWVNFTYNLPGGNISNIRNNRDGTYTVIFSPIAALPLTLTNVDNVDYSQILLVNIPTDYLVDSNLLATKGSHD